MLNECAPPRSFRLPSRLHAHSSEQLQRLCGTRPRSHHRCSLGDAHQAAPAGPFSWFHRRAVERGAGVCLRRLPHPSQKAPIPPTAFFFCSFAPPPTLTHFSSSRSPPPRLQPNTQPPPP